VSFLLVELNMMNVYDVTVYDIKAGDIKASREGGGIQLSKEKNNMAPRGRTYGI
jgi:hypothetical protein